MHLKLLTETLKGDLHAVAVLAEALKCPIPSLSADLAPAWPGELSPELARALVEERGWGTRLCPPRGGGHRGQGLPHRGMALLEVITNDDGEGPRFWVGVRPGARGREFFDPTAGGPGASWLTSKQWKAKAMPRHLGLPGRRGIFCVVGIEMTEPAPGRREAERPKDAPKGPPIKAPQHDPQDIERLMARLSRALRGHRIRLVSPPDPREAEVGPRWVRAYIRLEAGQSIRALRNMSEDIARALGTLTSDIHITNLPERHAVGIDLPIRGLGYRVDYDDLLVHPSWERAQKGMILGIPAGIDGAGMPVWVDLAEMPHMLVGGTTGSGKTVFLRTLLLSLILQQGPDALRLALSSGKPMDFRPFATLPHAMGEIVQCPEDARDLVYDLAGEMNARIKLIDEAGHDDISGFNANAGEGERMPRIVAVLDEYGDTVMSFEDPGRRRSFESCVGRLAQKARAAGIHLVLCMQRPDRKVLKGVIKSNILHRFALKLPQHHESRIILDTAGAEALLGQGDMLYKDGHGRLQRLQVPFLEGGESLRARLRGMVGEGEPLAVSSE